MTHSEHEHAWIVELVSPDMVREICLCGQARLACFNTASGVDTMALVVDGYVPSEPIYLPMTEAERQHYLPMLSTET